MPSVGGANVGINTSNGPDTRVPVLSTVDSTGAPTLVLTANSQALPGTLLTSTVAASLTDAYPVQMPYRTRPLYIAAVGDSITQGFNSTTPLTYSGAERGLYSPLTPSTINTSATFIAALYPDAFCAATDTVVVTWDGLSSLTVNIASEGVGARVDVTGGGHFRVVSAGGVKGIVVHVRWANKPATALSDSLTNSGSIKRIGFSFSTWFLASLARVGYSQLDVRNWGISGDATTDIVARFAQIRATKPDVYLMMFGVNNYSGATAAADILSCVTQANADGAFVIIGMTSPPNTTTVTLAKQYASVLRAVQSLAATSGAKVMILDWVSALLDPYATNGNPPAAYYNAGNVHPLMTATVGAVPPVVVPYLKQMLPDYPYAPCYVGDVYDATYNQAGNLIGNKGQFIGTAGTLNAAASTPTATGTLATGWSEQQSGNSTGATVVYTAPQAGSPVARTDGRPGGWQRVTVDNTAGGSSVGRLLFTAVTGLTAGMRVRIHMTVRVTSATRMNLWNNYLTINQTSGPVHDLHLPNLASSTNYQDAASAGSIVDSGAMRFSSQVIRVPDNVNAANVSWYFQFGCAVGGAFTLDMQDAFVEILA